MGKGWSKSEVRITTDRQTYVTGEEIQGQIAVFLTKTYESIAVTLEVSGTEAFTVEAGADGGRQTRTLDCLRYAATVFNGKLKKGQYQFPFAFSLPGELPDSINIATPQYSANVTYCIKAVLSQDQLTSAVEFTVCSPHIRPTSVVQVEETFQVRECCVLSSPLRVSAFMEKGEFSQSERLTLTVGVNTAECSQGVTSIRVDFLQVTRLRTQLSGTKTFTHLIKSCVIPTEIPARHAYVQKDIIEANFALHELMVLGATCGRLIHCGFSLSVYLHTSDSLCSDPQEFQLSVPVSVRCSSSISPQAAAFPSEWQPEVMEHAQLALPAKYAPSAPQEE